MPLNQNLIYRNKPRQQQLVYSKGHYTNWFSQNETRTDAFNDQDSVGGASSGNSRYR